MQTVGQHGCKWLVSGNANECSSPCNYAGNLTSLLEARSYTRQNFHPTRPTPQHSTSPKEGPIQFLAKLKNHRDHLFPRRYGLFQADRCLRLAVNHEIAEIHFPAGNPASQVGQQREVTLQTPILIESAVLFPVSDPVKHFAVGQPFLGFGNSVASDAVQHQFVPELIGGA